VALQEPAAISSSLSSAFSVKSKQLEIDSQLAPNNPLTSDRPITSTSATQFTRTIVVPVIEATGTFISTGPPASTDVYFIGMQNGSTTWMPDLTPDESVTIGTTTVTLSPLHSDSEAFRSSSTLTIGAVDTNALALSTGHLGASTTAPNDGLDGGAYPGWNASTFEQVGPTSGSSCATDLGGTNTTTPTQAVTTHQSSVPSTETIPFTKSPVSHTLPTDASGLTVNITFPTASHGPQKRGSLNEDRRLAVCEWVTATMRGIPASWRNNWDGSKTVECLDLPTWAPNLEPIRGE
jgi:hypothetical protein